MPYAKSKGAKIYYEVIGEGPPIVFGHGAMGNRTMWSSYGYVERLQDQYKLILVDARGHGKSDKLYTRAAYNGKPMVDDVVAVLDDLEIDQTHYWGFSMGGYAGFGLAKYYPHRLRSLILGGASPYLNGMTPPYRKDEPSPPNPLLEIMRRGAEEGVEAMIEGYRIWAGGAIHPSSAERLRAVDPRAMVAFFEFSWDDEAIDDVLPTMTMPCLLYIGDQDDPDHVLTYAKQMPNVRTLVLPGLNHAQTSAAVDLIVPRALEFLATGR